MDIVYAILFLIAVTALILGGIAVIGTILNPPPTRMLKCLHCGYIWRTKHPHNINNPPARCPRCHRSLTIIKSKRKRRKTDYVV